MKQIKTWTLAFTYVGCFLGAGFISGQELWQFFGAFGNWGYVGFALATLLFVVIGVLFIRLTQMTRCSDMDQLLVPWDIKWLRAASGAIGAVFLFFVVVSMSAGVGAMLTQLFGVPTWLGSAVFMLLVFAYYMYRTGNSTTTSARELAFRNFLENTLIARPRTKEMIVGWPMLMLFIWSLRRRMKFLPMIFGTGMTIGLVSVVNTFLHIRTPFLLSLLLGQRLSSRLGLFVIFSRHGLCFFLLGDDLFQRGLIRIQLTDGPGLVKQIELAFLLQVVLGQRTLLG